MNTFVTTPQNADNYGPSVFTARFGNSSPSDPNAVGYLTTNTGGRDAPSMADSLWTATKNAFTAAIGIGPKTLTNVTENTMTGVSKGIESTGQAIKKVATSASSGIKWGIAIVIILGSIILFGYVRSALRVN